MVFKKKGTEEKYEEPKEEIKIPEEKKDQEKNKEVSKPIDMEDLVKYAVSLEKRIIQLELTIYRLKNI